MTQLIALLLMLGSLSSSFALDIQLSSSLDLTSPKVRDSVATDPSLGKNSIWPQPVKVDISSDDQYLPGFGFDGEFKILNINEGIANSKHEKGSHAKPDSPTTNTGIQYGAVLDLLANSEDKYNFLENSRSTGDSRMPERSPKPNAGDDSSVVADVDSRLRTNPWQKLEDVVAQNKIDNGGSINDLRGFLSTLRHIEKSTFNHRSKHEFNPDGSRRQKLKIRLQLVMLDGFEERLTMAMHESYGLQVSEKCQIIIVARNQVGLLRGLDSLSQLVKFDFEAGLYFLPRQVKISHDFPRYPHRGLMIDTARHYLPKDTILKGLDSMRRLKLNVLHWHLTEDQSWPIASEEFPEIARLGAYSGLEKYTIEDLREIFLRAKRNGIRIVPEIDMPGHISSLWRSHPEFFSCEPDSSYELEVRAGLPRTALDPRGIRATSSISGSTDEPGLGKFLSTFFQELVRTFPGVEFLHVGSDEVPRECWNDIATQEKTTPDALFAAWVHDIARIVQEVKPSNSYPEVGDKLRPIFWDEAQRNTMANGDLKDAIIQVWNPPVSGITVMLKGFDVIMSPAGAIGNWYLDHLCASVEEVYSGPQEMMTDRFDYYSTLPSNNKNSGRDEIDIVPEGAQSDRDIIFHRVHPRDHDLTLLHPEPGDLWFEICPTGDRRTGNTGDQSKERFQWVHRKDSYLSTFLQEGDEILSMNFFSFESAAKRCLRFPHCGGITYDGGGFSMRMSSQFRDSPAGEVSWVVMHDSGKRSDSSGHGSVVGQKDRERISEYANENWKDDQSTVTSNIKIPSMSDIRRLRSDVTRWFEDKTQEETSNLGRIVGGEAPMWGETVDASVFEATVFPKLAAVAERLWSSNSVRDWKTALPRLQRLRCLMMVRDGVAVGIVDQKQKTPPIGPGSCYQMPSEMRSWRSDKNLPDVVDGFSPHFGIGKTSIAQHDASKQQAAVAKQRAAAEILTVLEALKDTEFGRQGMGFESTLLDEMDQHDTDSLHMHQGVVSKASVVSGSTILTSSSASDNSAVKSDSASSTDSREIFMTLLSSILGAIGGSLLMTAFYHYRARKGYLDFVKREKPNMRALRSPLNHDYQSSLEQDFHGE